MGSSAPRSLCHKSLFLGAGLCTVPVPQLARRAEELRATGSSLHAACILLGLLLLRRRQRAVSEGAVACRGPGQTQASNPAAGREPRAGPLRALFAQGKASRARHEEIQCLFFVGSPRVGADGTALPRGAGGSRSPARVEGARCPRLSPVKAPTPLIICPSRSAKCHVSCYLLGA